MGRGVLDLCVLRQAKEEADRIKVQPAKVVERFEAAAWALRPWAEARPTKHLSKATRDLLKDAGFELLQANGRVLFSAGVEAKGGAECLLVFAAERRKQRLMLVSARTSCGDAGERRLAEAISAARLDSLEAIESPRK